MSEMTAFALCVRLVAPGLRLGPSPRGGGRPLSSGSAWTANRSSHSPRVVGWTPPALEGCALSSCGPAGRGASVAIHPAPSAVALPRLTPRFAGCVQLSAGGRSLSLAFGSTWTVDPEAGGQPWTASRLTALCHRAMPPWGASPGLHSGAGRPCMRPPWHCLLPGGKRLSLRLQGRAAGAASRPRKFCPAVAGQNRTGNHPRGRGCFPRARLAGRVRHTPPLGRLRRLGQAERLV